MQIMKLSAGDKVMHNKLRFTCLLFQVDKY